MTIPDEAVEAATGVEIGDLNETVEAPWHLQPEEARRVLEAAIPHILTHRSESLRADTEAEMEKNMSDPKVVFEPVLGRWRVEYRNHPTGEWQTEVYASTLEGACEVAQEMTNHDLDGVCRVVDTQPDTVRVGDETPLTLDQYQQQAAKTAVYPEDKAYRYLIAGLAGEVGEVSSIFAKHWRGDGPLTSDKLEAELGDVLWFVAMLADEIGCDLSEVAQGNLDKLADRAERGKLKGSGDNR